MKSPMHAGRLLAVLATAALCVAVAPSHDADACAALGGHDKPPPYLAEELVLIDHDGETEHFVREVRFAGADEHFGFVVPTPTRPKVAKLEKSPFPALRRAFPYGAPREVARTTHEDDDEPWRDDGPHGPLGRIAYGGARGSDTKGGAPGVSVLGEQKVGAFTAFVLQADDAKALHAWLATNGLKMSPSASSWVARYVARKFFFTAFRYEKPPGDATELVSETVRITFGTPVPYYPYEEPNEPTTRERRVLRVWSVGNSLTVPVAGHGDRNEIVWKRPWREGLRVRATGADLGGILGGQRRGAWVQSFVDDKRARVGWGDVLLVPDEPIVLDDAAKAARQQLVTLLLPEAP